MNTLLLTHTVQLAGASTVHIAAQRISASWMWYIIRASGFTAAGLLILLMLSGIGQVTGLTYRLMEPIKAWAIHKAMALALCGAIAVHVTSLLLDNFVPFSLTQVLIPFTSHYSNGVALFGLMLGSIGVALGVLAMYGIVIIVLTSLGWIDSKKTIWKWTHYLSYFVMLAVFIHALVVGSDLKYGVFRLVWLALAGVVALGVLSRLWRVGTMRRSRGSNNSNNPPTGTGAPSQ